MTQGAKESEFLRLEQAVARLEQLVSQRKGDQERDREAHNNLKHRHELLRARTQAAIDGIDQILGEER